MFDKTLKHFVFMRFFPKQDSKYPHNVLDVDFLSKQLVLAKNNALKSLENQTNKNFQLAFIVHEKFLSDKKYKFIFTELSNATTLPLKFVLRDEIPYLVETAWDEYDFVIQSRMDFDDFAFKDAIEDTQNKVAECDSVLAYGYWKGYAYSNGEIYPVDKSYGRKGYLAILISLIWKSSFAKKIPFVYLYDFNHTKIKTRLQEFLTLNGLEFSENMFQYNTSVKAFIRFRGEFSHSNLVTNPGSIEKLSREKFLTTKDITKKQLEDEFGFHLELNSIE